MNYSDAVQNAKGKCGPFCKVCPVCDGRACNTGMPGPGAKLPGNVAARNYQKWQEICLNMDTIYARAPIDTFLRLFGRSFKYPIFAAPVGALHLHYGNLMEEREYNTALAAGCSESGVLAFTGDGANPAVFTDALDIISAVNGLGIPTVKPWGVAAIKKKIDLTRHLNLPAIAMDIDAGGLPFLKNADPPAGCMTVDELREVIEYAGVPFILKGIMTPGAALKAIDAGAAGIVVSNHGGRVLPYTPATAEVLADIADIVDGRLRILVDGGLRSGADIFKALALGADAVLVGRPFVPAVYGGGIDGVKALISKLAAELADTMTMCGAVSLNGIKREMLYGY